MKITTIIAIYTTITFTAAVPLSYNSEQSPNAEYSAPQRNRLQRRNPKKGKSGGKNKKSGKHGSGANLHLLLEHCTTFDADEVPSLQDQLMDLTDEVDDDREMGIATLKLLLSHCTTFVFGFESYVAAIGSNTEYGGTDFLGPGLADQGVPWYYDSEGDQGDGGFQLGKSNNGPWGGAQSVDGDVYAIFQKEACIHQTLSGLDSGQTYTITWSQRARNNVFNGIRFSYGEIELYNDEVKNTDWELQSTEFTATGEETILKICSTNPNEGQQSTFIDNIVISKDYEETEAETTETQTTDIEDEDGTAENEIVEVAENLILNPSFEENLDECTDYWCFFAEIPNWTTEDNYGIDLVFPAALSNSDWMSKSGDVSLLTYHFVYQDVVLEENTEYKLEFYVREVPWGGGNGYFRVGGVETDFVVTGEWELVEHEFTTPDAADMPADGVRIGFGGYFACVDDISLVKVE
jgi:hypothetical protein